MHWLKGEDFKGIKDDQAAERREFFLATDGKGRRGRQTNHYMGGMIMTEIRLKVDNPGKAVEVVVEALALEEARLQYSLELANKRLKFFGSSTLTVELQQKPCSARRLSSPPDDGMSKLSPSRQTPSGMAVAMP
jgi:hypothetical protein